MGLYFSLCEIRQPSPRSLIKTSPFTMKTALSRLDAVRSGSALTCQRAHHSLPSPFESLLPKQRSGIRILAARRRSVRLGSDVPTGTSFTTEPVRIPFAKAKKTGFEFSRLDAARSGSALTRHRRLIHHRARSNPFCKSQKSGIRILAARRRQVRLGSDVPKGTSFTTEPVRIPIAKQKRHPAVPFLFWRKDRDSNPSWGISPNTISSRAP